MSIQRTNKDPPFIHGEQIEEWDIKSANTSLMRYYELADPRIIKKFESMEKQDREVAVGKYARKNPDFMRSLEESFTRIITEFIDTNHLDESDIISIKKDAIFVRSRGIKKFDFGDHVHFVRKGSYTGCILIPNYEIYYGPKTLDIKGLNNELLPLHSDGMLAFFISVMESSYNWYRMNCFFRDYMEAYKNLELPYNAYREFNGNSKFKVYMMSQELLMDDVDDEFLEFTDISFNYLHIILETFKATQDR